MKTGIGLFITVVGIACVLLGVGFLTGYMALPSDGVGCKSICGLGLLFSFFLVNLSVRLWWGSYGF